MVFHGKLGLVSLQSDNKYTGYIGIRGASLTTARKIRQRAAAWLVLLLSASIALSGCGLWRKISGEERRAKEAAAEVSEMRQRCERYADSYAGRVLQSVAGVLHGTSDPHVYDQLTAFQLTQVNAAYTIATGESPLACALDFVVLATLSRLVVEESAAESGSLRAAELNKLYRDIEADAWDNAAKVLTPEQIEELRQIIVDWRLRNPDVRLVGFVRFSNFARAAGWTTGDGSSGSLLSLIGIDPLEGLDPAVRQIEQSRLLAERAIFYMQRLPYLVDLQTQRIIAQAAVSPSVEGVLMNLNQATGAMESYAEFAGALPDAFAQEREELIRQLSGEFLEQQAELRGVLVDLQSTLEAGSETALAIDATVQSIDRLMERFPAPEEAADAEPGKPFDINDYTMAATEFTRTARHLTDLVDVLGRESSQVAGIVEGGMEQGQALVDYLFRRALLLAVLLLLGILATALAYRWLSSKMSAGKA